MNRNEKKIIKRLNKIDEKLTFDEFNQLIDDLVNDIDDEHNYNRKTVRNLLSKYVVIKKNKIKFNTNEETDTTYKDIKTHFNTRDANANANVQSGDNDFMSMFNITCKVEVDDDSNDNNEINKENETNNSTYVYPTEPYKLNICKDIEDNYDDKINKTTKRLTKTFERLANIDYPEQKSKEWFELREDNVTASDVGCVLGENHYNPCYQFIVKKVLNPPFTGGEACYHGCKYEQVATMLYSYRNNVEVHEFGLVKHQTLSNIAASPDGIVGKYKLIGKFLTNKVGTMLEIKCPLYRKIQYKGKIKGTICPIYYWDQVQQQLETCDLDNCDFAQFKIVEYESRNDFIKDTNKNEPYKSILSKNEKGCLIEIMPKNVVSELDTLDTLNTNDMDKYKKIIYDNAKFLYPHQIEMSPFECDKWICETMSNFDNIAPSGYVFHRIIYWRLEEMSVVTIERDNEWFESVYPKIKEVWAYVEYLRNNKDKSKIIFDYIDSLNIEEKIKKSKRYDNTHELINEDIMKKIKIICNENDYDKKTYQKHINKIIKETECNKK